MEAAVVLLREAEVETKVVVEAVSLGHSHHSRNHSRNHSRSHRISQVVVHLVEVGAKAVVVAEVLQVEVEAQAVEAQEVEAKAEVVEEPSQATTISHRPQLRSSTSFGSSAWPMIP